MPLLRWLPVGQKVPYAKTRRPPSPTIPPAAEPARETNIDSGNDEGANQRAGVAPGPGLPPAAGSKLPTSASTSSTATTTTAEISEQHIAGRSAGAAQELEGLAASGESEAVVGESTSFSQGGIPSARNSVAEKGNESETVLTVGAVGRVVEEEEEEERKEEAERRGGGLGMGVGKGDAPRSDRPGQTPLCQGDDGKRWESDNSSPSCGGDIKCGEGKTSAQSRPADQLGFHESNGNDEVGGGGGDGGGRESDRGGAWRGHSGEGDEQREGSVAPSVASYDNDFEDDAQDSPLSRSGGGTTTGSCHGSSSSPVGGVQGAPMAEEPADTAQIAEGGSAFSEGVRAAVGETEQGRRQKEHQDVAATRIQRLVRTTHQQGVRGRHVEAGGEEKGATDKKAWLAAWRARRETQVRRAETDAAIKIQSTARARRASDEVNERRHQHATKILNATVNLQAFARRWKANRREAGQEGAIVKKGALRRTEPGTSPEQQKTLEGEKKEEKNDRSFSTPNQVALMSQAKERRHQSPKSVTTSSGAESSVGSGQEVSKPRESAKDRNFPEEVQGGSSAISSSSKQPTSKNSYSSLTSPGGRRSPSSGSEGSSLSGLLGSLNSSVDDDIVMSSSADSDVPTGDAKHRLGEGETRRTGGDREEERRDVGPTDSDKVPPLSSSSSGLVETAVAADVFTQLQRKEGVSAAERGGEGSRTTVQTGDDALQATAGPLSLSLSLSMDDNEEPASEEARQESVGGGGPPSSISSGPSMPGAMNSSSLVALSPVPEERALLATEASVSEYGGSDDLNFEPLSSSRDSQSVENVGKEAAKVTAPTVRGADAPKTQASGTAGALKEVPDARRDEAAEEAGDDSDGSLMSLSSSSSDS